MHKISNSSGSDSSGGFGGEDQTSSILDGWETDVFEVIPGCEVEESNVKFGNKDIPGLIKLANKKISLKKVLDNYKIEFEQVYSPSGWTHRCLCPFPDHVDSKPSFAYNSTEDRFNCFGCNRGGRAVQFIAFRDKKSQLATAIKIIESNYSLEEAYAEIQDQPDDEVDVLLLQWANYIRDYIQANKHDKQKIKIANGCNLYLDTYIAKNNTRGLDKEHLRVIITDVFPRKLI